MASYLVQEEDGTSHFTLEDSSGSILLEDSVEEEAPTVVGSVQPRSRKPILLDDEFEAAVLLILFTET